MFTKCFNWANRFTGKNEKGLGFKSSFANAWSLESRKIIISFQLSHFANDPTFILLIPGQLNLNFPPGSTSSVFRFTLGNYTSAISAFRPIYENAYSMPGELWSEGTLAHARIHIHTHTHTNMDASRHRDRRKSIVTLAVTGISLLWFSDHLNSWQYFIQFCIIFTILIPLLIKLKCSWSLGWKQQSAS